VVAKPSQGFVLQGAPFRGRLAEGVYGQLREDIEESALAPGTTFSEKELVSRFQISRTPIREALQRLLNEGYLRQVHRGYQVVELTSQEIINAYAVRGMLEGMAARQVASARRRVDIARLQDAHDRELEALSKGESREELGQAIEEFHAVLADLSANDFLQSVLKVARFRTEPYIRRRSNISGAVEQDIEQHTKLIQAIQAGDALLAELTARMLTRRTIRELTGRDLSGDLEMAEVFEFAQRRAAERPD
jgi:DNA-binding GntR family transcriptional regulator